MIGYIFSYLVVDRVIRVSNWYFVDFLLSLLAVAYFSWHIYAIIKCSPKKPKLSKEERQKLKLEKRRNFGKSFLRKLLLQESITNFDTPFTVKVIDVFCIANFLGYIF